ncbi:hypothetical protein C8Q77DRAFT_87673 [Trametes polyzona]|nr:hypothetical protein C8Q77DRAFT_87673 [Trametes polyzona]
MAKASLADFKNPEHFVPVKGKGWLVYCKICTPPDRAQGQPMSLTAALRHEQNNTKHKSKLAEAALWDWHQEQPQPEWTVPEGESAWDYDNCTSVRLNAYVNFWLEGIEAAERGETPTHMDVFITKYDKEYREEMWPEKFEDWDDEEYEEWPLEECEGVPGYWYSGGSFDPCSDGFDMPAWYEAARARPKSHTSSSIARRAIREKWWPDDPDPRAGWEWADDEEQWEALKREREERARMAPPSDETPPQTSGPSSGEQNKRRRRRRGRGRGQGQQPGKGAHAPDKAAGRVEVHGDRRAKVY